MRLRIFDVFMLACVVSAIGGLPGRSATAQLIQVSPGYVRAPFVRVYSYPDGSSYVRAPFVSVYSPPRFYVLPGNLYAAPGTPGPRMNSRIEGPLEESSQLTWRSLRQQVREGAERLDRNLARLEADAEWREYLKTGRLMELVADDIDEPPTDKEADELRDALSRYQATANSSDLRRISAADGFRAVHSALSELLTTPLERQHRQLAAASQQLRRNLSRINAPASWFDFLGLPPDVAEPDSPSSLPTTPGGIGALQRMLSNFEQTRQDPKYRVIAELPGFQSTHASLLQYIGLAIGVAQEAAEELPPPVPEGRNESQLDSQP